MTLMTVKELDYFKKLILKKRAEILFKRSQLYDDDYVNQIGETHYSLHMADQGSDTMDHELENYFDHRPGSGSTAKWSIWQMYSVRKEYPENTSGSSSPYPVLCAM